MSPQSAALQRDYINPTITAATGLIPRRYTVMALRFLKIDGIGVARKPHRWSNSMFWAGNKRFQDADDGGDDRFMSNVPAALRCVGTVSISCTLINLSRTGFRVKLDTSSLPSARVWLEVAGWPRIMAMACWQNGSVAGFMFEGPISAKIFGRMLQSTTGQDRQGGQVLI